MNYQLPSDHPKLPSPKTGILLVNLGTPDGTDYWSMRRYLSEFLSDRRVIEVNPWIWQPLLQLIILSTRPQKSGAAYKSIWNEEKNESPLRTITRNQSEKIAAAFSKKDDVLVDWAMRYGNPSIKSVIHKMAEQGCRRLVVFPLYPQYAGATTATVCDEVFNTLKQMRWQPTLRIVPPYYDHPAHIEALAENLANQIKKLKFQPELLLTSYHGMPKSYLLKGDPYHCNCHKTTRLLEAALKKRLKTKTPPLKVTFQSRFGPQEWLQPYTDETLENLPKQGTKNIAICTPTFSADCLETLEEIAEEGKHSFLKNGGQNYAFLSCLNDTKEGIQMLKTILDENMF